MNKLNPINQAFDDLGRLETLTTEFVTGLPRFGKEEKERRLGELRSLRKGLGFGDLPAYNSTAFGEWVSRQRANTRVQIGKGSGGQA